MLINISNQSPADYVPTTISPRCLLHLRIYSFYNATPTRVSYLNSQSVFSMQYEPEAVYPFLVTSEHEQRERLQVYWSVANVDRRDHKRGKRYANNGTRKGKHFRLCPLLSTTERTQQRILYCTTVLNLYPHTWLHRSLAIV